jgi:hypothetical protein
VEGGEQRGVVVQVGDQGGQDATGRRGGEPVDHLAQAGDEVGPDVSEVGEGVGGHDADHGVRDHGRLARPSAGRAWAFPTPALRAIAAMVSSEYDMPSNRRRTAARISSSRLLSRGASRGGSASSPSWVSPLP